jgi:hypothetical protein
MAELHVQPKRNITWIWHSIGLIASGMDAFSAFLDTDIYHVL